MLKSKVVLIGSKALDEKDDLVILFDKTATKELETVSIIQEFEKPIDKSYDLKTANKLKIDNQEYKIAFVGDMVNRNYMEIGHTVLHFEPVPAKPQGNAIYLTPMKVPQIKVGSTISFG